MSQNEAAGAEVNPPLAIGLFIKARYTDTAASLQPLKIQTSSTTLMILTVLMLSGSELGDRFSQ